MVPSFPFLTIPYSTLHRSVYQHLPWCILPFSTPVPYHILPCHLYYRPTLSLYHTPPFSNALYLNWTKPAQNINHSGPKRLTFKAKSTPPKIRPKRPGLTNTGPKRHIFLELLTSFFYLYPKIVACTST